eukprot:scaffold2361_cov203-Alexandrium_tamarense.AAC.32
MVLMDAAKAQMATVQDKLQQCVSSGQLNSFDRLSNLFAGKSANIEQQNEDDVEMSNTATTSSGKDVSKVPAKKGSGQKHTLQKMNMQFGDRTTRKVSEKRVRKPAGRGRPATLDGRRQRSSSKKRSGKKLATI